MRPEDLQRLLLSYNKAPSYAIQDAIIHAINNNQGSRLLFSLEAAHLNPIQPQTHDILADAVHLTFGTELD